MHALHKCATPECPNEVPMALLFCLPCLDRNAPVRESFAIARISSPASAAETLPKPDATTGAGVGEGSVLTDSFGDLIGGKTWTL